MLNLNRIRTVLDRSTLRWFGLIAGPICALIAFLLLPESYLDGQGQEIGFSSAGRATAAMGIWMAIWWMTEAIPIYATSLLPLATFPLVGAAGIKQTASPYGHPLIFLFMGGFILALSMERWELHRRFALGTLRMVGTRPSAIIGGFMLITATLSMWVSNTATTIMMLPIALKIIDLLVNRGQGAHGEELSEADGKNFALCLLLGIAYAASIGGIGTIIGTPPNGFLIGYLSDNLGIEISFARWMKVGIPVVVLFLPITWLVLTRLVFPIRIAEIPGSTALVKKSLASLGEMSRGAWATLIVFLLTAGGWMFRRLLTDLEFSGTKPFAGLSDAGIAMLGALALFVIPVDIKKSVFVMDWKTAVRLPWGILILFGGGLSLAAAIRANGVGEFIGNHVGMFAGFPPWLLIALTVAIIIFLTEMTSNTATTATLVPILAALAPTLHLHPLALAVPAAVAASCAFMLPVATPPNAIIFGSERVTIPEMCKAGVLLNLIGIVLITLLTYLVMASVLGFTISVPG